MDIVEQQELKEILETEIMNLGDRPSARKEQTVIRYRWGLVDGVKHTLGETGQNPLVKASVEVTRQIEERALRRLRQPDKRKKLEAFL